MADKKILKDEELEEVSGGKDWGKYLPSDHGRELGKYEAEGYIGQKVYAVCHLDREDFFWGTLQKSWEESIFSKWSQRKHKIHVEGKNDYWRTSYNPGEEASVNGDMFTLFLFK